MMGIFPVKVIFKQFIPPGIDAIVEIADTKVLYFPRYNRNVIKSAMY